MLQLQDTLTSDRAEEIRALADYNEALANLAAAEGSTLERHGIVLDSSAPPKYAPPKTPSGAETFVRWE